MELTHEITAGLRDIRKRRRIVWGMWLAYLPAVALLAWTFQLSDAGAFKVVGAYMAAWVAAGVWAGRARCPRCGERYDSKRGALGFRVHNPWAQSCISCQLPLRPSSPAARP